MPPPLAFLPRRLNAGILLILGALFFLAPPAQAQFIGDRIRITTEGGEKIIGEMQGYNASSLALLADSAEQKISYADMARLERSLGVRSYARKGARWGLAMGGPVGSLLTLADVVAGGHKPPGFAIFSLAGSMICFAVSAPFAGEHWERLDRPAYALSVGDSVRITTRSEGRLAGKMQEYNAHSLTILADDTEHSIPYADMLRLKKMVRVRRAYKEGAIIGLSAGVLASLLGNGVTTTWEPVRNSLAGGLLGVAMGGAFRRTRWNRLNVFGQGRASTLPIMGVHATLSEDLMRITTRNEGTITGRLQAYDAHSLTLHVDSTEHIISYADMLSLERNQGVWRYPVQGAWTGLGVGTLATVVLFASAGNVEGLGAIGLIYGALIFTAGGTALGLIIGTIRRNEKWERLDIPGQEGGLSVAPVFGVHPTGRLTLGARISF